MRKLEADETWVVYQGVSKGEAGGPHAVCERDEWEAMERIRPGGQVLIQQGIASEGAAERLARGTAGDTKPRAGAVPRPAAPRG